MSISQDGAKSVLAELERRFKEDGVVDEDAEVVKEIPKLVPPTEESRKPYREEE